MDGIALPDAAVFEVLPAGKTQGGIASPPGITPPVATHPAPPAPPPPPRAASAVPASNPWAWVRRADYPQESLRAGETGTVGFTLRVRRNGKPVSCTVTLSSSYARLDQRSCDVLMTRAHFLPWRAREYRTYSSRVRWVLFD